MFSWDNVQKAVAGNFQQLTGDYWIDLVVVGIIFILSITFGYAYANPVGQLLRLNRNLAILIGTVVFFGLFSFGVEQLL